MNSLQGAQDYFQNQTGIAGSSSSQNCFQWPYYQPYTATVVTLPADPTYEFKIRKTTNGFVVLQNGKEFVFETHESLITFLTQETKETPCP